MKADKLIISNRSALEQKYAKGFSSVKKDIQRIISADKKRGFNSVVCYVDDSATMKKVKGKAVKKISDAKAVKSAIDALYKGYQPDYLLIFGASDIIPFVRMKNPIYDPPEGDTDFRVETDLPYCCDSAYSNDPEKFFSPTRVVGRLPDIVGLAEPRVFTILVDHLVKHKAGDAKDFKSYFALSVWKWRVSTGLNLEIIAGNQKKIFTSPEKGPQFTKKQLKPKLHFINCHGSTNDTVFYGQKGQDFPPALTTSSLAGKVTFGTAVAAECCYGNQLFEPDSLEQMPICNRYLTEGALAMVGSSTTSYGPPQSLGLSDLITQYFLVNLLAGASTGRAFLQAQQKFLQESAPHIDPYEVKTYTQYYLLGDPSLVLVNNPKIFSPKSKGTVERKMAPAQRKNRRAMLESKGIELGRSVSPPHKQKGRSSSRKLVKVLKPYQMQGRRPLSFQSRKSFAGPGKSLSGGVRFHVVTKRKALPGGRAGLQSIEAVIVKEIGGQMVDIKKYEAK